MRTLGAAMCSALALRSVDPAPLHTLRYLNAARRGGTETARLEVLRGRVDGLPEGLDALLATSDLQGVVPDPHTGESTLLGVYVAEALEELGFEGKVPRAMRTGVHLCGDLYSLPAANKRGGYGDVAPVWEAFASRFAWVAGVAGNHDDTSRVARVPGVHLLDTEEVSLGGLRLGGVGLVTGDPARVGRRDEEEQLARVELVVERAPDVLLLHEGPEVSSEQPGHAGLRALLERHPVGLTVCGHVHWEQPHGRLGAGSVLNVDARAVVLTRA